MQLATAQYFSLRTKKKDGSQVDTPVWFVPAPEEQTYHVFANISSGKVKRIRNFAETYVARCDIRGKVLGEWQGLTPSWWLKATQFMQPFAPNTV